VNPARRHITLQRALTSCALLFSVAAAQLALAENWPGWRGPERNGTTTDHAPRTWSATSGVRWKMPLPGSGISNPIVWNKHVVCTSSDGPRQQDLHVICLDRDNGRERWHARLWGTAPTLYHETKSSMASPSPVTDGEFVYAFFGSGDVFCLELDSGQLVWQRSLAKEYGPFENRFAASSSPLLLGDQLILQCDHYGPSYVLAIDARTGANRWKSDRPDVWLSWSSPVAASLPGGSLELVLCGSERVDGYDPRDGRKLWTARGLSRECIPTPITAHGVVYVTSGPNGASYALRPGGRDDVSDSHLVWSSNRGNPFVPSAIVVNDYYYLVDDHGIGTCLSAKTGKTIWKKRLGGEFTASPVAANGRIYFTNEAGSTLVIQGGSSKYEELARNSIDEPVFASAAIADGKLFLRSAVGLWCFGPDEQASHSSRQEHQSSLVK
jgi:outer membrane protein assembly factor BamB